MKFKIKVQASGSARKPVQGLNVSEMTVKDKVFVMLQINPEADYGLIADLVGSNRDTVRKYVFLFQALHKDFHG